MSHDDHAQPRCLLVDDDPGMQLLLQMKLRDLGGVVDAVGTPEDALRRLHTPPVDMLLVDRQLRSPITGTDLLERFLTAPRPPRLAFLMSAHVDADVLGEAAEVGARPLDKLDLTPALEGWAALVRDASGTPSPGWT